MKDISLHVMDIAQNSVVAGATRIVTSLTADDGVLELRVEDNGKGMSADFLHRVTDPFTTTRTTRDVGLGIPLLKLSAEMAGGVFDIRSELGVGTWLVASFQLNHVDRIPVGDMSGTLAALIMAQPHIQWEIFFHSSKEEYRLDTVEISTVLEGVPLDNPEVVAWLEGAMREGMQAVFGGVLDEIPEGT